MDFSDSDCELLVIFFLLLVVEIGDLLILLISWHSPLFPSYQSLLAFFGPRRFVFIFLIAG